MEAQLNKESFLDGFKIKSSVKKPKVKQHTEGFVYLHDSIVNKLLGGESIDLDKLDFSKFTTDDLDDYVEYYGRYIEPKVRKAESLFKIIKKADEVFSPNKKYF